jgi:SAM-dependent methyltransferase
MSMIERPHTIDYDAELQRHNGVLRRAVALRRGDHVLDIGCGAGQTTREAARIVAEGSVLGIDSSARLIHRARELTEAEGLRNITFVHADAQVHPFRPGRFDVAISRFGTMFFRDAVAAFANVARAMRPGARLVMMVWQAHERNEWSMAIESALVGDVGARAPVHQAGEPFSLADPGVVVRTLQEASFVDVTFSAVHEPVYYGPDVATAFEWVRGFTCTSEVLRSLDPGSAHRSLERLRATLTTHAGADGVWLDSRAWIVAARRR